MANHEDRIGRPHSLLDFSFTKNNKPFLVQKREGPQRSISILCSRPIL